MAGQTTRKTDGSELRYLAAAELRVVGGGDQPRQIVGTAAPFNTRSKKIGGSWGFVEIIRPGAFAKSISATGADVRALWDHDSKYVIGRTTNQTLALRESAGGLEFDLTPGATQWEKDLLEKIDRGDISGMSFGFRTIRDNWFMEGGEEIRELLEVELQEISIVTFPAYEDTDVALRSHKAAEEARREADWEGQLDLAQRGLELLKLR